MTSDKKDRIFRILATIEEEHHMVHKEVAYVAGSVSDVLGLGGVQNWMLRTPALPVELHAKFSINSDNVGDFQLFENATVSADGAAVTIFNLSRSSSNTTDAQLFKGPTITDDGTELPPVRIGVNAPPIRAGATARTGFEWILKPDTIYLFRFTADNANTKATIGVEFYEETHE